MKKIILLSFFIGFVFTVSAQLKGVLDRAKQRVKDKATQKVNTTTDNTVDSAYSKSERAAKEVVKDITTKDSTKKKTSDNSGSDNNNVSLNTTTEGPVSFKTYSKYDFVPGEKVIGFEDFSTGAIGDFPAGWNTNAAGEIVILEKIPGRWLKLTKPVALAPNSLTNIRKISPLNLMCCIVIHREEIRNTFLSALLNYRISMNLSISELPIIVTPLYYCLGKQTKKPVHANQK